MPFPPNCDPQPSAQDEGNVLQALRKIAAMLLNDAQQDHKVIWRILPPWRLLVAQEELLLQPHQKAVHPCHLG